jgi:hypothetical protein
MKCTQIIFKDSGDFSGVGMAAGLQFGVQQVPVYFKFKPASVRRDKGEVLDFDFELFQKFGRQTDSAGGVVSGGPIG